MTIGQTCIIGGANVESVSILLGHSTTKTTEGYYYRKREDIALRDVSELFEPRKPSSAIESLIENEKYLSGYA